MSARSRLRSAFVLCSFLLLAGCRSNCDLVEAELRTREMQLADLRTEREQLHAYNEALQREIAALRGGAPTKLSPEEASQTFTLRNIVLGRQTGGLDDDGHPGDEALQVLVEPRDQDGHTIKVPGTLIIRAVEITPEGLKKPLSSWEVSGDGLRRAWKSGLLTTGYYLVLPWKVCPSNEKVRVVAQLTLSDGRAFEAEKDVTVRLVPAAHRPPPPPPDGPDGPSLPPPRKLEGADGVGWRSPPAKAAAEPSLIDAVEFRAPVPMPSR
jgi:hypothetical protein